MTMDDSSKAALSVSFQEDPHDFTKTLSVKGALMGRNAEILKQHCPKTGPLRIDLSEVKAIDGLGLAALVTLGMRPQIRLYAPPRCVRLPLEKTRLFQVLDIEG
jgi:anti-anti-sigma regulatory factor